MRKSNDETDNTHIYQECTCASIDTKLIQRQYCDRIVTEAEKLVEYPSIRNFKYFLFSKIFFIKVIKFLIKSDTKKIAKIKNFKKETFQRSNKMHLTGFFQLKVSLH